jgi:uncharacterized protein (DUF433 family)
MAFPKRTLQRPAAEVVTDPKILGGWPCVSGTRVPAMTIVAELRAGTSSREIFTHYPSLPPDGIEAVRRWAERNGISVELEAT